MNLRKSNAAGRRGFSLVELLTVVAIITLLIAILVPAVNKVREAAKISSTQATLGTLDTGINMFRQNQQIGGTLPPSASDVIRSGKLNYSVISPYSQLTGERRYIEVTGAGLLVWAMAGADLLGCPGFKNFDSFTQDSYWGNETTDDPAMANNTYGAYALDEITREPRQPRVAPFVDLSKVNVSKWNPNVATQSGDIGSFDIPAEAETRQATQSPTYRRLYPMFIDDFGGPLLYWRADPAGRTIADHSPDDNAVSSTPALLKKRGIYHFADNADLLDENENTLALTPNNKKHKLYLPPNFDPPVNPADVTGDPTNTDYNFLRYIRNPSVSAKLTPYNADGYLLISAGPDGLFGTADDIANFEHGGAALVDVP